MFCLNVALGNTSWRLLYKTEQGALAAVALLNVSDIAKLMDDFGQSLEVKQASIHGHMLEDLDKTKMAHVEMALHQQRTQITAQKMAETDPGLRAARHPGPAIIEPMNGFQPHR